jgi:hypothetical protein
MRQGLDAVAADANQAMQRFERRYRASLKKSRLDAQRLETLFQASLPDVDRAAVIGTIRAIQSKLPAGKSP